MDLDQNADFNKSFRINFDVFWGKYIKEGFFHVLSQYLHVILFL